VDLSSLLPAVVLAQEAFSSDAFGGLLLPMVFLAVLYILLIRPQSKRRKELLRVNTSLRRGDLVATVGGVHGEVQDLDERTVDLGVSYDAEGKIDVVIRFDRSAIVRVIERSGAEAEGDDTDGAVDAE
jgi:preprotein translocase subunit YajC